MKTREEIKALSFEEADKIEDEVLEAIDNNDLAKVKDFKRLSCRDKLLWREDFQI